MAARSAPTARRPRRRPERPSRQPRAACFGGVQYFFTGRYLQTTEGIENPLPTLNAIHDFSSAGKRLRLCLDLRRPLYAPEPDCRNRDQRFPDSQRARRAAHGAITPPVFGADTFNSSMLNENQYEDTQFGVLALQRSVNGFDGQLSYFTRYDDLHFMPDPVGDLLLNGIASDISRQAYTNGIQGDASYVITPAHTLRMGFTVSAEQTWVDNTSWVEPAAPCDGTDRSTITDDYRQARLARRRLCPGRVEDHRQADDECRPALRPDVAIHRRQSIKPAGELHLQAVREHDVACRLCALLHAAGSGRGGAGQSRVVQQHDWCGEQRRQQPGAAGALALFRCRRRSENSVRLL